jgi:hypothetical protein
MMIVLLGWPQGKSKWPYLKSKIKAKRAGGVGQVVEFLSSTEFKSQYCQKKKERKKLRAKNFESFIYMGVKT